MARLPAFPGRSDRIGMLLDRTFAFAAFVSAAFTLKVIGDFGDPRGQMILTVLSCEVKSDHGLASQDRDFVKAIAAALIASSVGIASAQAQVIDLSTLKCKEFVESGKQTVASVVMWLDGYLTDEEDPTVLDFDKMKATTEKLSNYCRRNPSMGLMNAAENVMGK